MNEIASALSILSAWMFVAGVLNSVGGRKNDPAFGNPLLVVFLELIGWQVGAAYGSGLTGMFFAPMVLFPYAVLMWFRRLVGAV